MSISRNNYNNITVGDRMYGLSPTGRFPLAIDQVKTSKLELEKYIKLSDNDGGNAYPGMLIAVDDDLTYDGNDATDNERGLYWITRDREHNNTMISYVLATKAQLDVEAAKIPTIQTNVLGNSKNYIYSDGSGRGGYDESKNSKTVLSTRGWFYEHAPNIDGKQYLRFKKWGAANDDNETDWVQYEFPQVRYDSSNDFLRTGIVGLAVAGYLHDAAIKTDSSTDDEIKLTYRSSFITGNKGTLTIRPAEPIGKAGIIPYNMSMTLNDNYIKQLDSTSDGTYLRFYYRGSFYDSSNVNSFDINVASQNHLGLMSSKDKCTVDAAYILLNKLNESNCPWDDLYEPDGNEPNNTPVMNTTKMYLDAVNGKMYEVKPIYYSVQDNTLHKEWGDDPWK